MEAFREELLAFAAFGDQLIRHFAGRDLAAQDQLRQAGGRRRMTRKEIDAVMTALGDLVKVIQEADPVGKTEIYG